MLKPQAHQCFSSQLSLFPKKTSLLGYGRRGIPFKSRTTATPTQRITKGGVRVVHCHCRNMKATTTEQIETLVNVKAQVTVKIPSEGLLSKLSLTAAVASLTDLLGKTLMLELYSSDLDPETGLQKQTVKGYGHKVSSDEEEVLFECIFDVPDDFGQVGAVIVENRHHNEIFLKDMVLNGLSDQPLRIPCNSWVASKFDNQEKRIFFADKSYLPSETPSGLKKLREEELNYLQGNGKGERKSSDRIYDYDKYNDLGDPDSSEELARPVLGGPDRPYPRRCRTGRPATKKDPMSESPQFGPYVPRDEDFSAEKLSDFSGTTLKQVLNAVLPSITNILIDSDLGFPNFRAIDNLFEEGFNMPKIENKGLLQNLLPRLFEAVSDGTDALLRFDTPELINRDKFSWLKDEEFSRQTLAGVNPYSIQLVTEWPLKSKLDPTIYGPAESSITKELIERQIKGVMTVDEALKQKKLFVLDYHDLLLPYVQKVRELNGTTLYGSRTLFFLTHKSTLRPIAIELTRPSMDDKPFWRHVYSTGFDSTDNWLWMFAKVHVCAHDSGYHELVSHWLRTHCCVEPYIIASHRQLSAMHPIFKLLHPHLRFTMEINALARSALINAGGIIERAFSPAKYSMELSSAAYDQMWRFDMEALPADLIRRGMAEEDPTEKHGLKLTIKDYPFANDGLLVWDAIKIWITDYVNHYYPESSLVETDKELQAWWDEIRTKGHEDKKDEPWWPVLNSQESLIQILSTIVWVASCHHAAVNFGQYTYGGYFPNRPAIARTNMPNEEGEDSTINKFLEKPESVLLECFPTQLQATVVMAILNVLSSHSSDEEYLGALPQTAWSDNPVIKAAYEQFSKRLMDVERVIDERNADVNLINRTGAGVVPYELLKLSSEAGVTGKGVPNSISI